jgi:hypothetical protein
MTDRDECHIYPSASGHMTSADCWCEPKGYWMDRPGDDPLFVVEHDDNHDEPDAEGNIYKRVDILIIRERDCRDWVTRVLNTIYFPPIPEA